MNTKRFIVPVLFLIVFAVGCAGRPAITYYENHPKQAWLNECGEKFRMNQGEITAIAKRQYAFFVYQDAEPNAFVNTEGKAIKISISDSMLDKLQGNDIYCLIAHESAHIEYNHGIKQAILSDLINTGMSVADAAAPGVGLLNIVVNPLLTKAYSRSDEVQADCRALDYLDSMDISYTDYVKMLMMVKSISSPKSRGGGILDTHPNFEQRIKAVEKKGKELEKKKSGRPV